MMNKFTVDQAVQAAIKPFVDTLKRFDDNTDDIGLFEWFNRYADEELIYDSLVNLAALQATPQPAPAGELVAAEIQALREMDEIYYLDWRENDDDENTAGWRYEGYYDINGAIFDRLIVLGLAEVQPSGAHQRYVRISKAGTAALKAGE